MKKSIIVIASILLAVNLMLGLLLSSFALFNIIFSSITIIATGFIIYLLKQIKLKDAFIVSLTFIFSVLGIITYILSLLSSSHIQDNICVIITVLIWAIEAIIIILCIKLSKIDTDSKGVQ